MTITPEKYIERMLDISKKKYDLMKEILDITKKQSEVITEDAADDLNEFIDKKQIRIDSIDKVDDEFEACFKQLKLEMNVKSLHELKAGSIEGVAELQKCIANIMNTVREISQLESDNKDKANELLQDLGTEIKKLNQAKKVSSVYSATSKQPSAYFIDKKN